MWKSIHSWKSTYSLLLSLVLMSGSLMACVQTGPETKSSPSTTSSPLNPDQGNSKNSFDDVQKTNNELAAIAKKNEEEIKNLNYDKQENYNQLNQFKNRRRLEIFIVIIVLAITLLLGGLCVYIWKEKRRKKWLLIRSKKAYGNTQKQNNAVNKTGDLDTQTLVYEKLFHEVHDKVEDVEKMYKLWGNEAKKLQNQIYNLQQNQQVKTPGNNVDNKKFIVKVVNDKIGEIYRQLQQEIHKRLDI